MFVVSVINLFALFVLQCTIIVLCPAMPCAFFSVEIEGLTVKGGGMSVTVAKG